MEWIMIGLIAVIVLIGIWYIATYNGFIKLKNMCEEAFSTMDIYLKKRFDLIPNLVETVKGYATHEKETLDRVTSARGAVQGANNPTDRLEAEGQLSQALGRLMMVSEAYPDLKANTNFMDLQEQLKTMETEIASSRKYYNGVVKTYNIKCESIPSNIVASIAKFEKKPLFEIENIQERENVKVQF